MPLNHYQEREVGESVRVREVGKNRSRGTHALSGKLPSPFFAHNTLCSGVQDVFLKGITPSQPA